MVMCSGNVHSILVNEPSMKSESHSVVSNPLRSRDLYSPWNSPGWNTGKPFPSPGDLPKPGIKPRSPTFQADSLPAEPQGKPIVEPSIVIANYSSPIL